MCCDAPSMLDCLSPDAIDEPGKLAEKQTPGVFVLATVLCPSRRDPGAALSFGARFASDCAAGPIDV